MVHGYHVIMPAYGFWLPNDPRGSWSDFVGKWELTRFGRTTKHLPRRTLEQLSPEEVALRDEARKSLKYPPVCFTGVQARAIAAGFAHAARRNGYTIWACAIMPEHTHLVIARHRYKVEQIANLLKGAATRELLKQGLHPLAKYAPPNECPPAMWAVNAWRAFLDSEEAIESAIGYVEENPLREGKPTQKWSFVTPFAGLDLAWVTYH
jgi:REP element-mobilizing transposase RayT